MERVFIELMHEEFISHRLQSSTFPPWVWSRITEKMNSVMSQQGCLFTTVQLKGKLSRLRRAWRLLNDMITKGTGWGWDPERNTITDDAGRLEELYQRLITFCDIAVGLHWSYGRHVGTGMGPPCGPKSISIAKRRPSTERIAICDFDMNFTYVYAGWEGSAGDARVLDHAVLIVERGITYLSGLPYGTPQDMFNHAHSWLRNVIERCFCLLKKRFPILQWGMPNYLLNHQVDIVIACCTLYNFIHKFSNDDLIFNEPDKDTPADMETFYHRGL
ncbi:hypothetical protein Sango_2947600 [Sesamum angolense]|uniref:DDE Tnp4 domain-containing protein n=1 Tax=Sesamum angolense TaxID=2727404 RepID=A0AAE1T5L9_9LAMI|nr:hypothetical protein Sango_2947600 [Sesamum angolense]